VRFSLLRVLPSTVCFLSSSLVLFCSSGLSSSTDQSFGLLFFVRFAGSRSMSPFAEGCVFKMTTVPNLAFDVSRPFDFKAERRIDL